MTASGAAALVRHILTHFAVVRWEVKTLLRSESFELSRDGVMLEGLFVLFRALFPGIDEKEVEYFWTVCA